MMRMPNVMPSLNTRSIVFGPEPQPTRRSRRRVKDRGLPGSTTLHCSPALHQKAAVCDAAQGIEGVGALDLDPQRRTERGEAAKPAAAEFCWYQDVDDCPMTA